MSSLSSTNPNPSYERQIPYHLRQCTDESNSQPPSYRSVSSRTVMYKYDKGDIVNGGKTFRAKKRARPNCGGKKLSDIKRKKKNYAEPEPVSSKVDGFRLTRTRKKQMELFQPCKCDVCERVKNSEVNFDKWIENHNHREQYFIGDDGVSKKRDKIEIFSFFNNDEFLPPSWSLVHIPESSHHEKVFWGF